MGVYFLYQAKHNSATDVYDKGLVVKSTKLTDKGNYEDALQGYHSYLGAYAYGHDPNTDYVTAGILDEMGNRLKWEVWDGRVFTQQGGSAE